LRVRVKLTLKILKIRVGIVIVAKLNSQTKTRVTQTIKAAVKWNIQPRRPCECLTAAIFAAAAGVTILTTLLALLAMERAMALESVSETTDDTVEAAEVRESIVGAAIVCGEVGMLTECPNGFGFRKANPPVTCTRTNSQRKIPRQNGS
jgi:hypothetical protein